MDRGLTDFPYSCKLVNALKSRLIQIQTGYEALQKNQFAMV
jgi:hypothetical protein